MVGESGGGGGSTKREGDMSNFTPSNKGPLTPKIPKGRHGRFLKLTCDMEPSNMKIEIRDTTWACHTYF